jgi:hypothetical protein
VLVRIDEHRFLVQEVMEVLDSTEQPGRVEEALPQEAVWVDDLDPVQLLEVLVQYQASIEASVIDAVGHASTTFFACSRSTSPYIQRHHCMRLSWKILQFAQ